MSKELKDRVDTLRMRFEELHDTALSGTLTSAQADEAWWIDKEIQLVQAEALVRLSYRSWM